MPFPAVYELQNFVLLKLEEENPDLYAKFLDAVKSGDTRFLTDEEIADLVSRSLVNKGIQIRAVLASVFVESILESLGEKVSSFSNRGGYLETAKNEKPELVERLIELMLSGESISDHEELQPLEEYHLVFRRQSDGKLDVHRIARTHLAYSTLKRIEDKKPEEL